MTNGYWHNINFQNIEERIIFLYFTISPSGVVVALVEPNVVGCVDDEVCSVDVVALESSLEQLGLVDCTVGLEPKQRVLF